jgi:hypothetical protein
MFAKLHLPSGKPVMKKLQETWDLETWFAELSNGDLGMYSKVFDNHILQLCIMVTIKSYWWKEAWNWVLTSKCVCHLYVSSDLSIEILDMIYAEHKSGVS